MNHRHHTPFGWIWAAALILSSLPVSSRPALAQTKSEPKTLYGEPYVAKSSSTLSQEGRAYPVENLIDLNPLTAWCEGSSTNGNGEWIEINLKSRPARIDLETVLVKILPGYTKTDSLFRANARPSKITLRVIDGPSGRALTAREAYAFPVRNQPVMQVLTVPVGAEVNPARVKILVEIDRVHAGRKYQDLCVTELRVFLREKGRDPFELSHPEEEKRINGEMKYLREQLPRALEADRAALQGLIRLADGFYMRSAEGGQWLNEIYLDLLVKHPYDFLLLVGRQEKSVRDKVLQELLQPVTDKYSHRQLLKAVRSAKSRGLKSAYLTQLTDFYSR